MHPVRARSERHIHTVVDDKRHAGAGDGLVNGAGVFDHFPRRAVLVAILQNGRAVECGGESKLRQRCDIAKACVDQRVEAVINLVHARSSRD
ncbi:hypothetical protein D3C72_889520 [compost metagenome]